jgi:plasmid stabilization system protein ParE
MRIRWTPAAAEDLKNIYDYLMEHEPHLARSTVIELRQGIHSLKEFPHMGRKGREEGTRELLHKRLPHIVVYRVKEDAVEILHIWHPAQDWP